MMPFFETHFDNVNVYIRVLKTDIMRYKCLVFSERSSVQEAKAMAEPEDQEHQGAHLRPWQRITKSKKSTYKEGKHIQIYTILK